MGTTNISTSGLSLIFASNGPQWCGVGSGSGVFNPALGSLYAERLSVRGAYTSRDVSIVNQTTWTFAFGATTMSGLNLKEIGIGMGSVVGVQDMWDTEHFPSITFDGTNEAVVQFTFKIV